MEDQNLLIVSLMISLIGTLGLLYLSEFSETETILIKSINESYLGKTIAISGKITTYQNKTDQFYTLTIKDNSSKITGILFSKKDINFPKNTPVKIIGQISEFNKQLQINIEKIEK